MRPALLLLALAACLAAQAQQLAQYTQYVFNQFSVNPAVAGSKDCIDLRLGYRQQWLGFEGAPTTGWASLHATLRPKGKPYMNNKHGIGAFVESDQAGHWGYTRFVLAYAYHIRMTQDTYFSLGFFGGVQQMKFNLGDVTLTDYNDPALDGQASVMVAPDITPGAFIYGKKGWGGVAMHQALANKIEDIGDDSRLARQFMLSGGYRWVMGRKSVFSPSALIKMGRAVPMAMDLNAMVEWNRTIALGVGYRNGDAMVLMMKLAFLKYFQLGYSYDLTTSALRTAGSNTHEIVLGITPCGREDIHKKMINCPAFD
ncbi:MAG: type IX secretion system membrane protein PorP/SprF [Flavobacteriales bacterium]|jgi:type IX secretion system PorP/SprF family membrane protein|nr:type IX secretion system membrane protein PorP/SprF [Flavobacteriales bacterium]